MKSARFHEIHQISWNPPDFIMKSAGFHCPNEPRTNGPILFTFSPAMLLALFHFTRTITKTFDTSDCLTGHKSLSMEKQKFILRRRGFESAVAPE